MAGIPGGNTRSCQNAGWASPRCPWLPGGTALRCGQGQLPRGTPDDNFKRVFFLISSFQVEQLQSFPRVSRLHIFATIKIPSRSVKFDSEASRVAHIRRDIGALTWHVCLFPKIHGDDVVLSMENIIPAFSPASPSSWLWVGERGRAARAICSPAHSS